MLLTLFAHAIILIVRNHIDGLILCDHRPEESMEYLSIRQTAEKWGISVRRIQILCKEKRIPGAIRIDYSWAIPADAEKPVDARIKSGKYMKQKTGN